MKRVSLTHIAVGLSLVLGLSGRVTANLLGKTTHCLVVSGDQHDRSTFGRDPFIKMGSDKQKFLGEPCHFFDSWEDLEAHYQQEFQKLDPKTNQFFVVQVGHGDKGGKIQCNKKIGESHLEDGEKILTVLRKMSKNHQVGSVLNSCYSGDVLKAKILTDEHRPLDELQNLCLATVSVSENWSRLLDTSPFIRESLGKSMEEMFGYFKEGLISSAAYTLDKSDPNAGVKLFQKMLLEGQSPQWVFRNINEMSCHGIHGVCIGKTCGENPYWSCKDCSYNTASESLKLKDEDLSPQNQARRKACREFQFQLPTNPSLETLNEALIHAMLYQPSAIQQLVEKGADPNLKTPESVLVGSEYFRAGTRPITAALKASQMGAIETLLKHGVEPYEDVDFSAKLKQIIQSGSPNLIEALINTGIDLNRSLMTFPSLPLTIAIEAKRFDIIRILLKGRADPNKRESNYSETPLEAAKKMGDENILKILTETSH